ncbi:MAG: hypothetical protein FVQ83_00090 [Chloroflexi bacterium]|nr:hypothetical protein [Chloroflexota bacterium]
MRRRKLIIWVILVIFATLACERFAGGTQDPAPTSDLSPTPNFYLTSIFGTVVSNDASQTPTISATATTVGIEITQTIPPTDVIAATAAPSSTPAFAPSSTQGYESPPQNPTTTPDPNGGPFFRSAASVAAVYVSPAPIIDGNLGEWPIVGYTASSVVFGPGFYSGPADLTADFKIGWDATNLYIGVVVTDNLYVQNTSGAYLYLGDSLEIVLDASVSSDFYDTRMTFDDHQLGISPGLYSPGGSPQAYMWYPTSKRGLLPVVNIAVIGTPDGYILEAALPWSLFGVFPAVDQHLGFAFSVSDNDAMGLNDQQTMISNVSTRFYSNPTTWGDLILVLP